METYWHNTTQVQAIQVKRPYRAISSRFPRSHIKNRPSGRLHYIRLVDAPEGRNRAQDGDWIVRREGRVEVVGNQEFTAEYTKQPPTAPPKKRVQTRAD